MSSPLDADVLSERPASQPAGALVPFFLAALLVGPAQGMASTGGIRALLAQTAPADRAGLLSTIYLISYCSAAISALISGQAAHAMGLVRIAESYAALGVAAAVVAMLLVRPTSS